MQPLPTTSDLTDKTWPRQFYSVAGTALLSLLYILFAWAAFRTWQRTGHIQMLVLAIQELIVVGLVITRRRSIKESRSLWDWTIALIGTASPLLQRPAPSLPILREVGVGLQITGIVLAMIAILSLGRSFGVVAANRGVRTRGLYRFVRHPLYASYIVGFLGFVLGNPSVRNIVFIVVTFICQYLRANAEERILAIDPAYQAYMQRVCYRFIPYIF